MYPKFTAVSRMDKQPGRKYHPGGVALASKLGDLFEYIGNREYRDGDNIRDLDRIATARVGRPIVREYRQEYFHRVAVILDTHVPNESKKRRAHFLPAFEHAVSYSGRWGLHGAPGISGGHLRRGPHAYHLTAGRSLAYLDQILDILACVEDTPDQPFEALEEAILDYLGSRSPRSFAFFWTGPPPTPNSFARSPSTAQRSR